MQLDHMCEIMVFTRPTIGEYVSRLQVGHPRHDQAQPGLIRCLARQQSTGETRHDRREVTK